MTLMAEEDSRVDMNVVVVAQTLRLFCVVVSVPFLAMQMLDETSAAVALEKPDEWHWLALIPICFVGRFLGKKFHLLTKKLLGPILAAALIATLIHPLGKAPHELMSMVQLNIGLYIGTKLDKDRLLALRPMIPNLLLGNAAMIGSSVLMAIFLSQTYGFTLITAFLAMSPGGITAMCIAGLAMGANVPLILSISAVQVADENFASPLAINWYFKKRKKKEMENLKGKRLLLLGGDFWTEELAQYAAETGVKLIATAKKAPTKLFEVAEESYTVDPTDAEGMKKLIREAKSTRCTRARRNLSSERQVLTFGSSACRQTGGRVGERGLLRVQERGRIHERI